MNRGRKFLIASDRGISITSPEDVADAMDSSLGRGLILANGDLGPAFFDLLATGTLVA
jgi:hypothetical protein